MQSWQQHVNRTNMWTGVKSMTKQPKVPINRPMMLTLGAQVKRMTKKQPA